MPDAHYLLLKPAIEIRRDSLITFNNINVCVYINATSFYFPLQLYTSCKAFCLVISDCKSNIRNMKQYYDKIKTKLFLV